MNFDIAIIGGGPAGYTAAERAGANGLRAVLFEKKAIGGVCLNEGCIPTKTLLYSAKILDSIKSASKYGISAESPSFDLSKIMSRKDKTVKIAIVGKYTKLEDSYISVIESLTHAGYANNVKVKVDLIDSEKLNKDNVEEKLKENQVVIDTYANSNLISFLLDLGIVTGITKKVIVKFLQLPVVDLDLEKLYEYSFDKEVLRYAS